MKDFFEITLGHGDQLKAYEVRDYINNKGEDAPIACKFGVFYLGRLVLGLQPDGEYLKIFKNPGNLDQKTVHLIIGKVEAYHL
jgi:hypothetical protein